MQNKTNFEHGEVFKINLGLGAYTVEIKVLLVTLAAEVRVSVQSSDWPRSLQRTNASSTSLQAH